MRKVISKIPFKGTEEQEQKLRQIISDNQDIPGAVMPVLQAAQEIYGYLPVEVQKIVAEGLNLPLEEVYGVATFYSQFALSPKGKHHISVCMGTACYVKGAKKVLETIQEELNIVPDSCTDDGQFSLAACRCIGACGLGPVMTIDDEVYGRLTPDMIPGILDQYR